MEETYEKISDTEAKKVTTTVTEEIVVIGDTENQLKQIEAAYMQIEEEYNAKKAELDAYKEKMLEQKGKMADIGVAIKDDMVVDLQARTE